MAQNAAYSQDHVSYAFSDNQAAARVYVVQPEKRRYVYLFAKRFFDIFLSICAIIVLSPLCLIAALAIKFDDRGPVVYSQTRAGKSGKSFRFYKFRSMCIDADQKKDELSAKNQYDGPVFIISDDPRITKVGRIIRKYSVDELPQLVNVLKGEMSIVGLRPPFPRKSLAVEFSVCKYMPQRMGSLGGI